MPFSYKPLWKILIDNNMKKKDLVEKLGIAQSTVAKMSKGEYVSMEILERICDFFSCQLSDIVEHVTEKN
ncbi:MAG: hypothetical protein BWY74_01946 [Firmicutes bacterium ADurb.Bin419]|nr:MAG: hypothetical protein BWY74_01946 [Firmicutes bacterium ADurb.Bin419]